MSYSVLVFAELKTIVGIHDFATAELAFGQISWDTIISTDFFSIEIII